LEVKEGKTRNGIFCTLSRIHSAATSRPGEHLNLQPLGTLQRGAPADIIAVKGAPSHNLKILEYPDLVISAGKIIVNNFPD
jgi:imidazolonepropionase-like amidohydrolase